MEKRPLVSIIIRTRNRQEKLKKCIAALLRLDYPNYNIVCVTDNCSDGTVSYLDQTYGADERFTIVHNRKHISSAYMYNLGIKHSTGDIVVFIDDDAMADKNCIREIVDSFLNHPKVVCVGGAVYSPGSNKMDNEGLFIGCLLAFKRSIFEQFSFDENLIYSHFHDEGDLIQRLRAEKYKLLFHDKAFVIHDRGADPQDASPELPELNHIYSRLKESSLVKYYFSLLYYSLAGIWAWHSDTIRFFTRRLRVLSSRLSEFEPAVFNMRLKLRLIYILLIEIPVKAKRRRVEELKMRDRKVRERD